MIKIRSWSRTTVTEVGEARRDTHALPVPQNGSIESQRDTGTHLFPAASFTASPDGWMYKQNAVYTYSGISLGLKE